MTALHLELPNLKIVPKEEWGSEPVTWSKKFKNLPLRFAVLSLTSRSKECNSLEECCQMMRHLQEVDIKKYHLKNIRYNFYLGSDGNAYEGRGWEVMPPNSNKYLGRHGQYLLIACIGDFKEKQRPVPMYKAQWDLLTLGVQKNILRRDFRFF